MENRLLRKLRELYLAQILSFWTGLISGYSIVGYLILAGALLFGVLVDFQYSASQWIQAALLALPFAVLAAVACAWLGHSLRNVGKESSWKWLWLSFLSSQVGCLVALYTLYLLDAIDKPDSWKQLLDVDMLPFVFQVALNVWLVLAALIGVYKLTAWGFRRLRVKASD